MLDPIGGDTAVGVFVAPGVTVSVDSSNAIQAGSGSTYIEAEIYGTVVSTRAHGMHLVASGGVDMVVHAGAFIRSYNNYAIERSAGTLINQGDIYSGGSHAVIMYQSAARPATSITNSGRIASATDDAIHLFSTATNMTFKLTNSGTIQGKQHSLVANSSNDTIVNTGRMIGHIDLMAGNDTYTGTSGRLTGKVFGGIGDDKLFGGADNDVLEGGVGADSLYGGVGNDTLMGDGTQGGNGADKLYGGLGIDTLTGGLGNDVFVFNSPVTAANWDKITDFHNVSGDNDVFWLENAYMSKIGAGIGASHFINPAFFRAGAAALDANDYIVYNRANGHLMYDSNGNAAGGSTLIAVLQTKPVLTYVDFVVI